MKGKIIYIVYIFLIFILVGYGFIGATQAQKNSITFYVNILGIPTFLYFLADMLYFKSRGEDLTTTIEDEPRFMSNIFGNLRNQVILGLLIGGGVFYKIAVTGSAFVGAPGIGIAPALTLFDSAIGNALYSGAIGIIENFAFFGAVFTTLIFLARRFILDEELASAAIATILTILVFTGYHSFVYGANQAALLAVSFFAVVGCISTYAMRSLIIIDGFHAFNNFAVTLGLASRVAFQVIV